MQAISAIGVHYKFGGNSPESGIDCSGLVGYVFNKAWGTQLPRTSAELSQLGKHIAKSQLEPGDLVFYNTRNNQFSHVGIYLGDDQFIHAPSRGKRVRIENMNSVYWTSRFNGARRLVKPDRMGRYGKVEEIMQDGI